MFRKIIRWHPPLLPALVSLAAVGVLPHTDLPARVESASAAVLTGARHLVVRTERPDSPAATARARGRGTRAFRAA